MSFNIKSQLGLDQRRFRCDSFVSLQSSLQEIYNLNHKFSIKYKDEEGDLVTIGSETELREAFESQREFSENKNFLKILVVEKHEAVEDLNCSPLKKPKQELSAIESTLNGAEVQKNPEELNCQVVKEITASKGSVFLPGEGFNKIWKIKNTGTLKWPLGSSLKQTTGEILSLENELVVSSLFPGEETSISMTLRAPKEPGRRYISIWKLCTPSGSEGRFFGEALEVDIFVDSNALSSSFSTPIISFSATSNPTPVTQPVTKENPQSIQGNRPVVQENKGEKTNESVPYMKEVSQLLDMGFAYDTVANLLAKFNGSMMDVINEVLRS